MLTILTQIGGLIYILSIILINNKSNKRFLKRILTFSILYLFTSFVIIPKVSPFFGRVKIEDTDKLKAHNFLTKLCNRNYVTPKLHETINDVAAKFDKQHKGIQVIYLDACFPFFDGFPLLPHLSHNDGKKIDLSFIYKENKTLSNLKPSNSGYGVFENPKNSEFNQTKQCLDKGYWQYDFTKYFTLGTTNSNITFDDNSNKFLISMIAQNRNVSKIFIEPHLKQRLQLKSSKIRFHGCGAVRHDDHIHIQVK